MFDAPPPIPDHAELHARPDASLLCKADYIICKLDHDDYAWAIQWKWGTVLNRQKTAHYISRPTRLNGKPIRVYLHKEILKRSGLKPRTKKHTIGDHIDGNTLNNTRANLRWATPSMNRRNDKAAREKQCRK